ncbi:hypothetical protein PIB30_002567 [Stylosanthes scabra]|uniref:Uncharacterized protein n=1 Tax=Stylosanthes scabra TaxID=79078 RepID=A0ABU6Z3J5_9FABA|nr:hypothetical protein [Stylosanthes scabra]
MEILMNSGILENLSNVVDLSNRNELEIKKTLKDNVFANDHEKYIEFVKKLFEFKSRRIDGANFLTTVEELLAGHTDLILRFKTFAIRYDEQFSNNKQVLNNIKIRLGGNKDIYKSVFQHASLCVCHEQAMKACFWSSSILVSNFLGFVSEDLLNAQGL